MRRKRRKRRGRRVFCPITQQLRQNHQMWKRVIAMETKEKAGRGEEPSCIRSPAEPITAIHEEEEPIDDESEKGGLSQEATDQSETSGRKEE